MYMSRLSLLVLLALVALFSGAYLPIKIPQAPLPEKRQLLPLGYSKWKWLYLPRGVEPRSKGTGVSKV